MNAGPFADNKLVLVKSLTVHTNTKGDNIVSSGFVSYAKTGKTEKGEPLP